MKRKPRKPTPGSAVSLPGGVLIKYTAELEPIVYARYTVNGHEYKERIGPSRVDKWVLWSIMSASA